MAGGTLVVSTTIELVEYFGAGDPRAGIQRTVILLSTIAVAMFLACFFLTEERIHPVRLASAGVWEDALSLLKNDQWVVVAALNFTLFVALTIQDGAAVYYIRWYVRRSELTGAFLTAGMISSMLGSLFAEMLVARLSKRAAYSWLQGLIVLVSIGLFAVGPEKISSIFMIYALQQFLTQMASPVLWSMMADTTDYGESLTGRRTTGLAFSGMLFCLKAGMAVGGAILGWALAGLGYTSGADIQSTSAVNGIVLLFTIAPAIGHFLLIAIVQFYRLDRAPSNVRPHT